MKKLILFLIGIILLSVLLPAQVKEHEFQIPDTTRYSSSPASRFLNENLLWSNKESRWNNTYYSVVAVNWFTNSSGIFRTDFLTAGYRFFGFSILSVYTFNFPMNVSKSRFYSQLFYPLPIGLKLPLLSGKNFDVSASADFYWPVNWKKENHDSAYYELHMTDYGLKTTYKNTPSILDFSLSVRIGAFDHLGISAIAGYRSQLSDWYGKNYGRVIYSNNLSGFYFGAAISYSTFTRENKVAEKWAKALRENSASSYKSFLMSYAGPYETEARERMEDRMYLDAINGTDSICRDYLRQFPTGQYITEVQIRKDNLESAVYMKAKGGTPSDCRTYLMKYPDGRYVSDVNSLLTLKLAAIDSGDYAIALAGSELDCDKYLRVHPDGKYISEIKSARLLKIEQGYYNRAIIGDYVSCDTYLETYPRGRYTAEVTSLRREKYEKAEEEAYRIVAGGNYNGCEAYLNTFPGGRHYADADIICAAMRYDKPLIYERFILNNPKLDNIIIVNERPAGQEDYLYFAVVTGQSRDTMTINSLTSEKRGFEFMAAPMSDKMMPSSSIGLQGSKLDITLMRNGFNYDDRIWYPTSKSNALIICKKDKIIGFNVRYAAIKKK